MNSHIALEFQEGKKAQKQGRVQEAKGHFEKVLHQLPMHRETIERYIDVLEEENALKQQLSAFLQAEKEKQKRPLRILMQDHTIFAKDCKRAFEDMGFTVKLNETVQHFAKDVKEFQPDVGFTINAQDYYARELASRNIPYFCWMVDPIVNEGADFMQKELINPSWVIFSFDEQHIPFLQGKGFENIFHLPLATDELHFNPTALNFDKIEYLHDVSFVGTPVVVKGNGLQTLLNPLIETQMTKKTSHPFVIRKWQQFKKVIEEALEEQDRTPFAYRLPSIIESLERKVGFTLPPKECELFIQNFTKTSFAKALGQEYSSWQRVTGPSILAHSGVKVALYGNDEWKEIEKQSPHLEYRGGAAHYSTLPKIYSLSKINLNFTRVYAADTLPMRIFDIPACAGFLLTNYCSKLRKYFKVGEEIEMFRDYRDLVERAHYYLRHDEQRQVMAIKGFKRVLKDHLIKYRIHTMLTKLKELGLIYHEIPQAAVPHQTAQSSEK